MKMDAANGMAESWILPNTIAADMTTIIMNVSQNTFLNEDNIKISYTEALISGIFMAMSISLAVIGNCIVILAVCTQKALHAVQNYFLVSLAVADITVGVFVMPLSASYYLKGQWVHGYIVCDVWRTLDVCLCTASILNLCAIAMDRYWAITNPVKYAPKRTKKRICLIIAFVWFLSGLISVPPLVGWDERKKMKVSSENFLNCTLSQQRAYIILSATTSFYIPFLVMCIVYLRIYNAIRVRVRGRASKHALYRPVTPETGKDTVNNSSPKNKPTPVESFEFKTQKAGDTMPSNRLSVNVIISDQPSDIENVFRQKRKEQLKINIKKERRAARTLGIILGAFTVCWLPFFLMYVILPFCKSCNHPGIRVEAAITWIGYVNSACNPIVYTVFNRDFRSAFLTLLFGKCIRYRRKRLSEKKLTKASAPN